MVKYIKEKERCALWVDMGLGKTIATLTAISDLFDDFIIKKVLIIAPLKVALRVWPNEILNWTHTKNLSFTTLIGSPQSRAYRMKLDTHIHIINRENLIWLFDTCQKNKYWPYDFVVVDEASSFKNPSAKRSKSLAKISFHCDRLVELTATPASNALSNLWSQIFFIDCGERLHKSYTEFLSRYFVSGWNNRSTPAAGAAEKIYSKVADVCLRLKDADYIKLPPLMEHRKVSALEGRVLETYLELEKNSVLQLSVQEEVIFNTGALINKLLQYCNGAVYHGTSYSVVHDLKLDMLEEVVEECGDEPLLVGYQFRSDLERIKRRFPHAVTLDKKGTQVPAWNNGDIKMLLAHPASAGHGINLQQGGSALCWFGLSWSLELIHQMTGRLYRQGQLKPVQVYYLLIQNSADDIVMEAIKNKNKSQKELLEGVVLALKNKNN